MKKILICLLLVLGVSSGFGFELVGIDISSGLLWLGNGEEAGAPSPIKNFVGFSFPLRINRLLSFEPEMIFFTIPYQLSGPKALPTEIEYAHQILYITLITDATVSLRFPLGEALEWGGLSFLSFVFHLPTISFGDGKEQYSEMTAYLFSMARFIYPGIGLFLNWKISDSVGLNMRVKGYFPWFHLWDREGAPFYDQMMISGAISLRFFL